MVFANYLITYGHQFVDGEQRCDVQQRSLQRRDRHAANMHNIMWPQGQDMAFDVFPSGLPYARGGGHIEDRKLLKPSRQIEPVQSCSAQMADNT